MSGSARRNSRDPSRSRSHAMRAAPFASPPRSSAGRARGRFPLRCRAQAGGACHVSIVPRSPLASRDPVVRRDGGARRVRRRKRRRRQPARVPDRHGFEGCADPRRERDGEGPPRRKRHDHDLARRRDLRDRRASPGTALPRESRRRIRRRTVQRRHAAGRRERPPAHEPAGRRLLPVARHDPRRGLPRP
jgi:hypothetical protein